MLIVLTLYAAMGVLLGLEHYHDLRDRPRAEAIIAAVLLGTFWFAYEFFGAAHRVWEDLS